MISRIGILNKGFDTKAQTRLTKLHSLGFKGVSSVLIIDVYTIEKKFTLNQLDDIAQKLSNPITQDFIIKTPKIKVKPQKKFNFAIEIGFLPGVTDNIAHTAKEIIEDGLKIKFSEDESVYTSQVTFLSGKITKQDAQQIALSLHNPLIQRSHIKSYDDFIKDGGMDAIVPKVKIVNKPQVDTINIDVSDKELTEIGKAGIKNPDGTRRGPLALSTSYMKTIQKYFKKLKRNPTDIELETLAQTWSEHCKHTIFADPIDEIKNGLYKTYIKGATMTIRKKKGKNDFCVSVFSDNSGAIVFDENHLITHKVETHNSPSALDPFGGAITGIVGVNRDALGFGMGAKPVANFYGFCLSDPRKDIPLYRDKNKTQKMLSSRRIMDGVIEGINAGGNQSGIPTPQGFVYFDERYRGKPLVFAGTIGVIPRKIKGKSSHIKKARPGDYIVMAGGRIGKDGIHGATFSSLALDSRSPAAAVQIGDPITQKKMSDAIIKEVRDQLLYSSITDCGAGGISCSVSEMARESNGCEVELDKAPLKYNGLDPWEIWISESQERMTFAVPTKNWKKFEKILTNRGIEVSVIGKFTNSGRCVVKYKNKKIVDIDLNFLHDGLPKNELSTKKPNLNIKSSIVKNQKNLNKLTLDLLSRLNIASYEFISQQYDHIVQGNAVLGPLQGRGRINADASVIRPILDSKKAVVLSHAIFPSYSEIDPYKMAAATIDTAIRNAVATGADPAYLALLDNFCWCSSNEPARLWQLKEAVRACYETAIEFETPFISGKDSMFNDFKGFDASGNPIKISIPPTLLISSIGIIDDLTNTVSPDAKFAGDLVYILGETNEEMGGSEYFEMLKAESSDIPKVNPGKNKKLYQSYFKAIRKDLIASSISIGRGGLGIALCKKAIGGQLGINIDLSKVNGKLSRNDFLLFSESQGRMLISITPDNKAQFEKIMRGNAFSEIGKITKANNIDVNSIDKKSLISINLKDATASYRKTFMDY